MPASAPFPPFAAPPPPPAAVRRPRDIPIPQRIRARRSRTWLPLTLGAIALAAAITASVVRRDGGTGGAGASDEIPQAVPVAPPASWQPLVQALPFYTLEAPGWGGQQGQSARRHSGGGREDTLTLGGPGSPLQFRLTVTRGVSEGVRSSFYVDLVRRAAEAGLAVDRSAPPALLATKFGIAEAAPATIGGLACLAVRFRHPDLAFRLHGWLCGSQSIAPDGDRLACLLDGLVLAGGSEDAAMKVLFTQADQWRTGSCAMVQWPSAPA